jgi:hypothetical protein
MTRYSSHELALQLYCNLGSKPTKTLAIELGKEFLNFKARSAEQADENEGTETENRSVGGSIPPLGTIQLLNLWFKSK